MSNRVIKDEVLSDERGSSVKIVETDAGDIFIDIKQNYNKIILNKDEWIDLKKIAKFIKEDDK